MLTPNEQNRLDWYKCNFGIMNADEAMVEARWNEDMASKMPPNDPAHTRYKNESEHYRNYAGLLKK